MKTILCLVVLAAGCTATNGPKPQWTKEGATSADLEQSRAACTQQAVDATAAIRQQDTATRAALGEFVKCMQDRGWALAPGAAR